jgi:hypothetical protein
MRYNSGRFQSQYGVILNSFENITITRPQDYGLPEAVFTSVIVSPGRYWARKNRGKGIFMVGWSLLVIIVRTLIMINQS